MRAALFIAFTVAGLVLTFAVSGCAVSSQLLRGTGVETMPPHGYERLCKDDPTFEACTP